MDPRTNPYAPGAGTLPPELAGRDEIIEKAAIALDRFREGLPARSLLLVGLRGVGKTVLLTRISQESEARGFVVVNIAAPEKRSLPALLIPPLRAALLKLDRLVAAGNLAKKALRALGGFVGAMKLKYQDIEFGVDLVMSQVLPIAAIWNTISLTFFSRWDAQQKRKVPPSSFSSTNCNMSRKSNLRRSLRHCTNARKTNCRSR